MISIIIPAHNEEGVIRRCLEALTQGADAGTLEVLVVCNGCTDATAQIAREFGPPVRVIETDIASKSAALNLGDAAANGFPRVYVDADVVLPWKAVCQIVAALSAPGMLAAAPVAQMVFAPGTSWSVRAYYRFWMALPYVREGLMAAGVYAMNEQGRRRFDIFPDVIADDGFIRLLFTRNERILVASARSSVSAPATLWDLILIKTRSRLGFYQLKARCPELFHREARTKHYGRAGTAVLRQPWLWPCVIPYLLVNLVARWRAQCQLRRLSGYRWERDNSSRAATGAGRRPPVAVR